MKVRQTLAIIVAGVGVSGCISILEGTSQDINVVTNPGDASCVFERQGMNIGTIAKTPGVLHVRKNKYDITIKCNKPGYQEAYYLNHSGVSTSVAANVAVDLLVTAGVSSIVDSATGADNNYDRVVNISLIPESSAPAAISASARPVSAIPAP